MNVVALKCGTPVSVLRFAPNPNPSKNLRVDGEPVGVLRVDHHVHISGAGAEQVLLSFRHSLPTNALASCGLIGGTAALASASIDWTVFMAFLRERGAEWSAKPSSDQGRRLQCTSLSSRA